MAVSQAFEERDVIAAVMFGQEDVISQWVQDNGNNPASITKDVLFPAAHYGQIRILKAHLDKGDLTLRDNSKMHPGWTLYHFAVDGYNMNCSYLLDLKDLEESFGASDPSSFPKTRDAAAELQLDIIQLIARAGAPISTEFFGDEEKVPPPSLFALDQDRNFIEAAFLLDILSIELSKGPSATPGLDCLRIPANSQHRQALAHIMEWAYLRNHRSVMAYCHERYLNLCSDSIKVYPHQLPLFLDAVVNERYDILSLILELRHKRPIPDSIVSRPFRLGNGRKASALSLCCEKCCQGSPEPLVSLLNYKDLSAFLRDVSLSELALDDLPSQLFHKQLHSLIVTNNNLTTLPAVSQWDCQGLSVLDISQNRFTELPVGLFSLPKLRKLDISENQITSLDVSMWTAPALETLVANRNKLFSLPFPAKSKAADDGKSREGIVLGRYQRPSLDLASSIHSIRHSFVDLEAEREEDYHKTHSGYNLEHLDLADNQFVSIPRGLPCLAPLLLILKMSRNNIKDFGHIGDYPTLLKSLHLQGNQAERAIRPGKHSQAVCLQHSAGRSRWCTHSDHLRLVNLQFLDLSDNALGKIALEMDSSSLPPGRSQRAYTESVTESTVAPSIRPTLTVKRRLPSTNNAEEMVLLFPKLQTLLIRRNQLDSVPAGLHKLERLCSLDLSSNPDIRNLPLTIHHLKNLYSFQYKGIQDPIVHELDKCQGVGEMLYYLRARETEAITNTSMRMFIIGHYHKGKTSVLRALQGRRPKTVQRISGFHARTGTVDPETAPEKESTVGIECDKWVCVSKRKVGGPKITFYTWDFAGQEEYYQTHQVFLTSRALYLLVWNVTDGPRGIVDGMGVWLRTLQAKAPGANVIVIGTHLDELRKRVVGGAKQVEMLLRQYEEQIVQEYFPTSKTSPVIRSINFVAVPDRFFGATNIDTLVESIYDVASDMEVPRTHDMPASFHMKILDEKIPRSYVRLEEYIVNHAYCKNVMKRDEFCELVEVKDIIPDAKEVGAAINFLHNNVGTVLHFERPMLTDYYILNPQWWFDACALLVAPNNISTLVKHGAASSSGLLKMERMLKEFSKKDYKNLHVHLVVHFLIEFGIIATIDVETALMPSMIRITPEDKLCNEPGIFPYGNFSVEEHREFFTCMTSYMPTAMIKSVSASIKVKRTGLILRRMFLLPPLPSGFWSKLICLCLQKEDFHQIISRMCDPHLLPLSGHGLRRMIGNMELEWTFWKTGIVLTLDSSLVLRINSLYEDEYKDPSLRAPISETNLKVGRFHFVDEGGKFIPLDPRFSDVIEVIIPELELIIGRQCDSTVSTKLLAKALEILDEVLKGHCEPLAEDGIYSMNEMCHVVPCPICFGDRDNRIKRPRSASKKSDQASRPIHPRLATRLRSRATSVQNHLHLRENMPLQGANGPVKKSDVIVIFAIDQCIQRSTESDFIICPAHDNKEISLECLVPDIIFKDLMELKLERNALIDPPGSDGSPVGSGCFGVVYHKLLLTEGKEESHCDVAVKTFRGSELDFDAQMEAVKTYADMRYELNKLSVLDHQYVVKFIGLLPNPWSFILEWAPLMSLEKLRSKHEKNMAHFCPSSLFVALMQVADGLSYLHDSIGIIHNDLKLSNILAYDFPPADHVCCTSVEDRGRCVMALPEKGHTRVKVKLGDMGVCANPTGQFSNNHLGVKRFAPECIVFETRLTEKVDVFCLALCLYELMTLRSIPPQGMSEMDYKSMIRKNKRPPFHSRDPGYSLALYLSLEQCWMQEHNKRPSASSLRDYLEAVTGVSVSKSFQVTSRTMHHLLDSYPISSEGKATSLYVVPNQESLSICLGVLEGNTSRVVLMDQVSEGAGNQSILKTRVMHQTQRNVIVAVCVTQEHDFFIGYQSGRVVILESKNSVPYYISKCSDLSQNDLLKFLHYIEDQRLLVVGYKSGHVSITKLRLGAEKQAFIRGQYCHAHPSPVTCFSMLYRQSERFELWCGCAENKITAMSFPPQGAKGLMQSSFAPKLHSLDLNNPTFNSPSSAVVSMVATTSMELMFGLVCDPLESRAFCVVDVATKNVLHFIHCQPNISCFNLTQHHFIMGTEDGEVMVHSLAPLVQGELQSTLSKDCVTVSSHKGPVSHLLLLDDCILQEGFTSLFPTYLGRQSADTPFHCLITVGEGLQEFGPDLRTFSDKPGDQSCNINIWMI